LPLPGANNLTFRFFVILFQGILSSNPNGLGMVFASGRKKMEKNFMDDLKAKCPACNGSLQIKRS